MQWSRWTPSIIHDDAVVLEIILKDNFARYILHDHLGKIILCKINSEDDPVYQMQYFMMQLYFAEDCSRFCSIVLVCV